MPDFGIVAGDTNVTIYVRLRDSTTGLAKTGLVYNSTGAVCSYVLPGAARAAITLATQTVTGAHSDGGFVEVDATNCKGLYRLDLPDAAVASGAYSLISIEFDGIIEETVIIPLSNTPQTGDSFARLGAPAGASVSADIADLPTVAEFEARTILAASYFDPSADTVANVTTVGSVTGNVGGNVTGSVGSISGVTFPTNFGDLAITVTTGQVTVGTNNDKTGYSISGTITTLDALDTAQDTQHSTTQGLIGTPSDFGSGTSTIAANLEDIADNGTATYDRSTDSLQAIRDRGDSAWTTGAGGSDRLLMVDTTIATLASQTSFTLTAGSADDSAYVGCTIVIEDASTSTQKAVGIVDAYTGATKTVTLLQDPGVFTMAASDKVYILAEKSLKATTAANYHVDVTSGGGVGIDWANVENASTSVDLSATSINLCDTVTTNTDMRGTDSAYTGTPPTVAQIRTEMDSNSTQLAAIVADTNEIQGDWTNGGRLDLILDELTTQGDTNEAAIGALNDISAADVWASATRTLTANTNLNDPTAAAVASAVFTTAMTESYRSADAAGTLAQYIHEIIAHLGEFAISGTTKTTKKLDGTTTAKTYTLDDATSPTSITEAT